MFEKWRQGRRVPKNIYVGDEIAGQMQTEAWAEMAVVGVNSLLRNKTLERERALGIIEEFRRAANSAATEMSPDQLRDLNLWCDRLGDDIHPGKAERFRRENSSQARQADP